MHHTICRPTRTIYLALLSTKKSFDNQYPAKNTCTATIYGKKLAASSNTYRVGSITTPTLKKINTYDKYNAIRFIKSYQT